MHNLVRFFCGASTRPAETSSSIHAAAAAAATEFATAHSDLWHLDVGVGGSFEPEVLQRFLRFESFVFSAFYAWLLTIDKNKYSVDGHPPSGSSSAAELGWRISKRHFKFNSND